MSELPRDAQDEGYLVMPPEQIKHAVELSERLIKGSVDNSYDWASGGSHHVIMRDMAADGTDTLFVAKITIDDSDSTVTAMRYIIDMPTSGFLVMPGMYDDIEAMGTDDDPDLHEDGFAMMFALGQSLPNDKDWGDMIDILEEGMLFKKIEHPLKSKLGGALFSELMTLYADDEPANELN